ncbi:response regulator [Candidatus Sumerlaeota bacterium]|nr:response regulator [Candidatus Sumerlaeota bacterium]
MPKTVVIVEDDADSARVLRVTLERDGCKVFATTDGINGLELIKKHVPDAVVIDIKVPRMNGYEICTTLQSDEKLNAIPIMVITGLIEEATDERDREWCERLGVADFMSKPFEPEDFSQRIRKMLE